MIDFELLIDSTEEGADPTKVKVSATSRDILMWERTTKGASLQKMLGDPKMEDLTALAHKAAFRQGHFRGTFEEFIERVDIDFDLDELQNSDETDPDPS